MIHVYIHEGTCDVMIIAGSLTYIHVYVSMFVRERERERERESIYSIPLYRVGECVETVYDMSLNSRHEFTNPVNKVLEFLKSD